MNTDNASKDRRMLLERPLPCQPRMPRLNRAKLFAPYDALKPFETIIHAKYAVDPGQGQAK